MIHYDLHMHSNFSDGQFSPGRLVKMSSRLKLKVIAITDHDTVRGVPSFLRAAKNKKMIALSGLEISTRFENFNLHLLGYNIDIRNKDLQKLLKKQKQARMEKVKKVLAKLKKCGLKISFAKIKKLIKNGNIGKPHIARVILSNKKNRIILKEKFNFPPDKNSIDHFIINFLNKPGQPGFVKKKKVDTITAIKTIKKAGGIAVLAHPQKNLRTKEFSKVIKEFKKHGLDGVEVYDAFTRKKSLPFYHQICRKYNLLITFGSDFHRPDSNRKIGGLKYITNSLAKKQIKKLFALINN